MTPLSKCQKGAINGAFEAAIEEGRVLNDWEDVETYLKEAYIGGDLKANAPQIFSCYLSARRNHDSRPTLPPSPVSSSSQKSQASRVPNSIEREGYSEEPSDTLPRISSKEPPCVCFFDPSSTSFERFDAKYCEGGTSYISRKFVEDKKLGKQRSYILLRWQETGPEEHRFRTRCEVIDADQLHGCDVALAEECGKSDEESVSELNFGSSESDETGK
ncbi:uncharacterized protein RCO7_05323 [Rhynchosporium graminicola]|uniref:Uncharacterized protein n=1 Tax=Rhynchosporium graminicola TaxID=2792576 RepID=A0A1E1L3S7_9HELO|nr:uncharacterized protein RCO7_05323 [Rhynchosporium commune]